MIQITVLFFNLVFFWLKFSKSVQNSLCVCYLSSISLQQCLLLSAVFIIQTNLNEYTFLKIMSINTYQTDYTVSKHMGSTKIACSADLLIL